MQSSLPPAEKPFSWSSFTLGMLTGCGTSILLFLVMIVVSLVAISTLGASANKTFSNVSSSIGS